MSSNFYYIMSKDIGVGPELIGKLECLSKDDYQFVQDITNGSPLHDGYERIYFYKEIPEQVIRYDH